MAVQRWKVATVGDAFCWAAYEDTDDEIKRMEVVNNNPRNATRLAVFSPTTIGTKTLTRPEGSTTFERMDLTGIGKRIVEPDGEINFPAGMTFRFETLRR